jgi:leucyl-tRNA---protein transferase
MQPGTTQSTTPPHAAAPPPPVSFPRQLLVVYDHLQPCPYLPDRKARMPLHFGMRISESEFDGLLEQGFRRSGHYLYRTQCPACQACEPTRVDVASFHWTTSLKRVWQKGEKHLRTVIAPPTTDRDRVDLFNRHRKLRQLDSDNELVDIAEYESFLVNSCCLTTELAYYAEDRLVGVAIVDVGRESLSAVYCHFDPEFRDVSLGTYSILKQFQYAKQSGRKYVYLGMYVEGNAHLTYKARFLPQQRFRNSLWVDIDSSAWSGPTTS